MHYARYYREKAAQARRLAGSISQPDTVEQLLTFAKDYDEIAIDLESGAVAVTLGGALERLIADAERALLGQMRDDHARRFYLDGVTV